MFPGTHSKRATQYIEKGSKKWQKMNFARLPCHDDSSFLFCPLVLSHEMFNASEICVDISASLFSITHAPRLKDNEQHITRGRTRSQETSCCVYMYAISLCVVCDDDDGRHSRRGHTRTPVVRNEGDECATSLAFWPFTACYNLLDARP